MTMRQVNIFLSLLILILSFLFWNEAGGIRPPAHIYPRTVIGITAFLGFALLIQSIFFPKALVQGKPFEDTSYGRVLITIISTIIYFYAVTFIGFYVSSFFFLILATWILGERNLSLKAVSRLGGLALLVVLIVYGSFKIFLKVPTPTGILF